MGGPLEGWWVASKGLAALPRIRRGALGRGWGREGGGALPLPRAAAVSTGLRVQPQVLVHAAADTPLDLRRATPRRLSACA